MSVTGKHSTVAWLEGDTDHTRGTLHENIGSRRLGALVVLVAVEKDPNGMGAAHDAGTG